MCIRDRPKKAVLTDVMMETLSIIAYKQPITKQEIDKIRGCLLYTSDAADERSSVDLGGRRIIKKKKSDREGQGVDKLYTKLVHNTRQ